MLTRTAEITKNANLAEVPASLLPNFGKYQIYRYLDPTVGRGRNDKPYARVLPCSLSQGPKDGFHIFEISLHHGREPWIPQAPHTLSDLCDGVLVKTAELISLGVFPTGLHM